MSVYLQMERDRLLKRIEAIRETGEVALPQVRIMPYLAFNQAKKPYSYFKLVAPEPILMARTGGKTKTLHLGNEGNVRYRQAALAIQRRDAIQCIEEQIERIEELLQLDVTLPNADEFWE